MGQCFGKSMSTDEANRVAIRKAMNAMNANIARRAGMLAIQSLNKIATSLQNGMSMSVMAIPSR